jgi:transcriptional regulator GlxA family with amidase domain
VYAPAASGELFCERVKRLDRERVQKVIAILKANLDGPLSLEEMVSADAINFPRHPFRKFFSIQTVFC